MLDVLKIDMEIGGNAFAVECKSANCMPIISYIGQWYDKWLAEIRRQPPMHVTKTISQQDDASE